MPSTSVSSIEDWNRNVYYKSDEEYRVRARRRDERGIPCHRRCGILAAGRRSASRHLLRLPSRQERWKSAASWIALRVEAINHALRGHSAGPRPLPHLLRHQFRAARARHRGQIHRRHPRPANDARTFSFEAANPRHEHEWTAWRDAKLPDDVIMIPGMVTQSNVMVEHPEVIAQRLRPLDRRLRPRARHRRHRLRLRELRRQRRNPREHRLGEARGAGRGRADRVEKPAAA